MGVFELLKQGHEQVIFCNDPTVGLKAIIAIHSTALGPSLGGCRMFPYKSEVEALEDVLRLSRGMTYKAAVAGLNLGGGKAVIIADPQKDKTEALFRAFGRHVESLGGRYITAEDMGTKVKDMAYIRMETNHVVGLSAELGGSGDPSPVTALGTFSGIQACLEAVYGHDSLKGRSVAIQGLGNVGHHLARYLHQAGATLYFADVEVDRARQAQKEFGGHVVGLDEFFGLEVDVLSPCAVGGIFHEDTIPRLRAPIIAGAANNPLRDEQRDGRALHERGILYAPDYVINAGGLINVYSELHHYPRERALHEARSIREVVTRVIQISRAERITPTEASNHIAEVRLKMAAHLRQFYTGVRP
ncbi:MAG: Glu/Leu/Phe/Val family dehydrogenase [Myxococcota bacterium]